MFGEPFGHPVCGTPAFGRHDYAPAVTNPLCDFVDRRFRVAAVGLADLTEHGSRLHARPADPIGEIDDLSILGPNGLLVFGRTVPGVRRKLIKRARAERGKAP